MARVPQGILMTSIPPPRCALCREPIGPKQPQVPWGRGQKRGVAHRECAEEREKELPPGDNRIEAKQ